VFELGVMQFAPSPSGHIRTKQLTHFSYCPPCEAFEKDGVSGLAGVGPERIIRLLQEVNDCRCCTISDNVPNRLRDSFRADGLAKTLR
jgi:hypothetical protein